MNELSTDKITYDPNTGQRFVYVGAGKSADNPEAIVAYSPSDVNGRAVVFADGSVQTMSAEKFQEALQRDAALPRVATAVERAGRCPGSSGGGQPGCSRQRQPQPSRRPQAGRAAGAVVDNRMPAAPAASHGSRCRGI